MPTAAEFDEAATLFEDAATGAGDLLAPIADRDLDDVLRGGRLRATVEAALGVSSANVLAASDQLRVAAGEARLRAEECRKYATAMNEYVAQWDAYERSLRDPELTSEQREALDRPEQPAKPYDWIEL